MKVLFLGSQNIYDKISSGGVQCSRRNFDLIRNVVEKNDLYSAIVWNCKSELYHNCYFNRNESNKDLVNASLHLCRLYKVSEECKILNYINSLRPDVLFVDTSIFGKLLNKINPNIKTIVFMHNVEAVYTWNKVQKEGMRFIPIFFATIYNERIAVKKANKIISLNYRDASLVQRIYNRKTDYLLPISFKDTFDPRKVKRTRAEKKLLFVGSNFPPNYDGIKWFVNEVMNELKEYYLIIVGKDFEKVKEELTRDNVEVVGTVDYVDDYYYNHSIIVMPIKYGDGMKVKTAEAMMYGMNIFATDEALEGYSVEKIKGIFRCNSPIQFIESIREYNSTKEGETWNKAVRECFLINYNLDKQKELMKKIFFDVTDD